MNWKDKAEEILKYHYFDSKEDLKWGIPALIEFAKLVCKEQKKICSENAEMNYAAYECEIPDDVDDYVGGSEYGYNFISKNSIINSPTVNFD